MKFKFKKHARTGRYAFAQGEYTDIKLGKQKVGGIYKPFMSDEWSIQLKVKKAPTTDSPANFKNIILKAKFAREEDARIQLQESCEAICKKFDLYMEEI